MSYIERHAAIDAIDESIRACDKALGAFDISLKDEYAVKAERASLKAYKETLQYLPAADVVPVAHGEWIKYTGMGKVQWMCSKCSAEEKNPKVANYCYHCGAKMDGKRREE